MFRKNIGEDIGGDTGVIEKLGRGFALEADKGIFSICGCERITSVGWVKDLIELQQSDRVL